MALKNFQVGCQEENLASYLAFMQEQKGNTQAEKLDSIFRLARKGAMEEGTKVSKESLVFKETLDKALKIFDGMAAQVAGLDILIKEKVAERTAKIEATLEGQKDRLAAAEIAIRDGFRMEKEIKSLKRDLENAHTQIEMYKEKLGKNDLDENRFHALEKETEEQKKNLEKIRLAMAVLENDQKNKDEQIAIQKTRIGELEQENRQDREQAKNELKEQNKKNREEWEAKIAEVEKAHMALVESLKAQIVIQQNQILAMIGESDKGNKINQQAKSRSKKIKAESPQATTNNDMAES